MYRCQFSTDEQRQIRHARNYHPDPIVRKRMAILWHKHHDLPHYQIAELCDAAPNTVTATIRTYLEKGLTGLQERQFNCPISQLEPHRALLIAYFSVHPPRTLKAAAAAIERLTHLTFTITHVRHFLLAIGLSRKKQAASPDSWMMQSEMSKKTFIHEQLERNLDDAKHGRKQVYFVDAAHFVLQPFLGFLWCFQRFFVYSASGRQRFNVLGALNAMTHEVVTMTNNSSINARSVCDLLHALATKHTGEVVTLFLDNARYQKCRLVQALAAQLKIELIYLPAYSPNLNLIERLWRHVKQQVLYSRYYDSFSKFQTAIMDGINGTQPGNRESLRTLFSLKFQIIEKSQILNT